jgi:hypothetical protein
MCMTRRTMIVTIEINDDDETDDSIGLNHIEEELLNVFSNIADSCGCYVHANLCVNPLAQPLIDKLCELREDNDAE